MKFYLGNPKEGGKEVNFYEFLKESKFIDRLKKERGITINPTHDFHLLKQVRLESYKKDYLPPLLKAMKLDKVKPTKQDLNKIYFHWLKEEMSAVLKWREKVKMPDLLQIEKYDNYLIDEARKTQKELNYSFDNLYADAIESGLLPCKTDHQVNYENEKRQYEHLFNNYIHEKFQVEVFELSADEYRKYLTIETFETFLIDLFHSQKWGQKENYIRLYFTIPFGGKLGLLQAMKSENLNENLFQKVYDFYLAEYLQEYAPLAKDQDFIKETKRKFLSFLEKGNMDFYRNKLLVNRWIEFLEGKENMKGINQESQITKKEKKKNNQRQGTLARYKQFVETYTHFVKVENMETSLAREKTCTKHSISDKTLERAIKET